MPQCFALLPFGIGCYPLPISDGNAPRCTGTLLAPHIGNEMVDLAKVGVESMKMITAIVRPQKLQDIQTLLVTENIERYMVENVMGCGNQWGYLVIFL
jgi:Nitrogen regulatory protein P-II